jgi:RNA polymerase subunit RPABC4/transcription elongation factor Spt4
MQFYMKLASMALSLQASWQTLRQKVILYPQRNNCLILLRRNSRIMKPLMLLGGSGFIRHIIHSDVVLCPNCNNEFTYFKGMVKYKPLTIDGNGVCPHCGYTNNSTNFPHVMETVYDSMLGERVT